MTVRAWFTISAVAMTVLAIAFVYRFFLAPVAPPEILVTAAEGRVPGSYETSCWPRRGDEVTCDTDHSLELSDARRPSIAGMGTLRVIVAFPQQPERGTLRIVRAQGSAEVLETTWTDRLDYDLEKGTYILIAEARYPSGSFVRYAFPLDVL